MAHPHAHDQHDRHEKAHALIARTGHARLSMRARGGHVTRDEDEREDEALVAEGVHKHESHLHKGQPKTKLKSGGHVEGHAARQHLGKRARGGATGKKGTHVNVIVAPQGGGMHPAMPMAPAMAAPRPAAPPPPSPAPAMAPRPMGPPPGAMGAPGMATRPPGMMKRGGGVKRIVEAGVPSEALSQAKRGGHVRRRAAGGDIDDCDEPRRARGGHVPHMEAGAGGGEGRIEKMHEYGEGGFKPKKHTGEFLRDRNGLFTGGRV